MLPTLVLKDDNKIRKFMRRLLVFCLDWYRDEELGEYEEATITIRRGYAPQFYYGNNAVIYEPARIEENKRCISKKPNWISAEVSKGTDTFKESLPLGFDEKKYSDL